MRRRPPLLLIALVLVGCASAHDAYTDGMDLEVAGDYAAATDAYITALQRDPAIRNVPGRLAVAGRRAVGAALDEARQFEALGSFGSAAEAYLRADGLIERAAGVGVALERPSTFAEDRDATLAAAVDEAIEAAASHHEAGRFESALAAVREAQRFRPSPARQTELSALTTDVYGDWAESDLDAGRYHAALAHTDAARAGATGPRLDRLDDLRERVLDAGSVVAAVLPAEGADDVAEGFLRDVTDILLDDGLVPPPPFVLLVDPVEVRRWNRQQRGRRPRPDLVDSPRRIADAAADLGADFGVALFVRSIDEQEHVGEARTERARLRNGDGRVSYTRRDVDLTLSASADLVVVTRAGQTVCDETVRQRAEGRYGRATYDGDWRTLDLSRAERAMFGDHPGAGAAEEAMDQLRDELVDALAGDIASCLDRQVD